MTDTTRTIALDSPFEGSWVKIQTEVKMRVWDSLQKALLEALRNPDRTTVDACLAIASSLIVEHNLLDVETGEPLTFSYAEMSPGQILAVLVALTTAFRPGGESADPLPPTETPSEKSAEPSSPISPSPSTSPSSVSPSS